MFVIVTLVVNYNKQEERIVSRKRRVDSFGGYYQIWRRYKTWLPDLVIIEKLIVKKKDITGVVLWIYAINLTLKSEATHLTEYAVHSMLNGLELGNTTFLALNMLAQSTQSCESGPTSRGWTDVNLVLMDRAWKMLVQGCQWGITAMT